MPGDIQIAQDNYYKNNISDDYHQPLSVRAADLSELNRHGESLRIYMSFMYQFSWLSFALFLLSAINAYINYQGGYYNGDDRNAKSDQARDTQELIGKINLATLSNFKGYTNFTSDPRALNWVSEQS